MKKNNDDVIIKAITALVAVLIVIAAIVGIIKISGSRSSNNNDTQETITAEEDKNRNKPEDFNAPASIEPIALPDDLEATAGFEPHQLNMLTDHYALVSYDIGQDSVVYHYQTAAATTGERLSVICTKMSQDDYFASVPQKNVTTENYNNIELTYSERWLYSVPNNFKMMDDIEKGIEEGTMEIEYGNDIEEVITKNCFYWYQDGIKYEIQVRNQSLPYNNLFSIAKSIIDA